MIKNKKLWTIVASCTIIGGVLIAVGGIVISQKTETTYKDLLKEAQEKYFDVIDKTIDKNVQKKDFRFDTNDQYYGDPYGELKISTLDPFDEELEVNIYRKNIFFNKDELNERLIKFKTENTSKNGINSWDYYDEDFFKENILIRVAYRSWWKYVKTIFDKKTNKLIHTFVANVFDEDIYERWENLEKDDDIVSFVFPDWEVLRTKISIFIPFKKSDLKSDDLKNVFWRNILLDKKIDLWNFLKEEKKANKF